MPRQLILLRHAKSSWESDAPTDFERPLANRGIKATKKIGKWLKQNAIKPDLVLSSPASRARQTIELLTDALEYDKNAIQWPDNLYMADIESFLSILASVPRDVRTLMLVGHNPGMEELLIYLCRDNVALTAGGKLMPTCTVAVLHTNHDWDNLSEKCCHLKDIARPKEL